ncbi:hypothetical protein [Streptomyces sp. NPDC058629]|uniref:hypothetical protein n=1 Tax=Streptomyces sp. NPDC058629 TaxID=3346565 RepID=UPI00365F4EE7
MKAILRPRTSTPGRGAREDRPSGTSRQPHYWRLVPVHGSARRPAGGTVVQACPGATLLTSTESAGRW